MLATVSVYQDRIVPRDTDRDGVLVDVDGDADAGLLAGHAALADLPVAHGGVGVVYVGLVRPVACDHGRPSPARMRKAMGGRIAPGSPHIHNLERAHGALVRDGGLESKAHRADVNDPVYLERMEMVNDLCSRLKRYPWRFTGMSLRNLQAYLDWYVHLFRVNQAHDRWDPTARMARHILMADATYRSLG